jgi:hypothetical protein
VDGVWEEPKGVAEIRTSTGKTVRVRIHVKDHIFTAYLDGVEFSRIYDSSFSDAPLMGLGQWYEHWYREDARIGFDNFQVGPWWDASETETGEAREPERGGPERIKAESGPKGGTDAKEAADAAARSERAARRAENAAMSAKKAAEKAETSARKTGEMVDRLLSK